MTTAIEIEREAVRAEERMRGLVREEASTASSRELAAPPTRLRPCLAADIVG